MEEPKNKAEALKEGSLADVNELFSPLTIRKKCREIFRLALDGKTHFKVHQGKLEEVAQFVTDVTLNNYPTLNIPFHSHWTHFQAGKINRLLELKERSETLSQHDSIKAKLSLIIISVLLEATAGLRWRYREEKKEYVRSEGQAVACFRMFISGFFSSNLQNPLQVDAKKLLSLTLEDLEKGFQVGENNMLIGLEGRLKILHNLGKILQEKTHFFGSKNAHLGNMLEFFLETSSCHGAKLKATQILRTVQDALGSIWAGRLEISGINLGDVSIYRPFGEGLSSLVPFHKLSQWLSYSLLEPLQEAGITITHTHELTGLAEYRNGGLMLDSGLIELKDPSLKEEAQPIHSEPIVEWRALTITLLDELSQLVAQKLGKTQVEFPLSKVLEGGTWWAGRAFAQKLREDGSPPLKVISEGFPFT